jgi:2-oxoglutarate ferredoxin oxidoreductase subunit beta
MPASSSGWRRASRCCSPAASAGLTLDRDELRLRVVDVEGGNWHEAGVLLHDPTNKSVAHMLIDMPFGPFPMALGVIYEDPAATFETAVREQNLSARAGKSADLQTLVGKGQSWEVNKEPHLI